MTNWITNMDEVAANFWLPIYQMRALLREKPTRVYIGDPKGTEKHSVSDLKKLGIVGLIRDTQK